MPDGDRFVALDGGGLVDDSKRLGIGSGRGCGVYGKVVEGLVMWDGGLEQLVEGVWVWLEALDGVVEGSVFVWVEEAETEFGSEPSW